MGEYIKQLNDYNKLSKDIITMFTPYNKGLMEHTFLLRFPYLGAAP
jgi:hypothetical protein